MAAKLSRIFAFYTNLIYEVWVNLTSNPPSGSKFFYYPSLRFQALQETSGLKKAQPEKGIFPFLRNALYTTSNYVKKMHAVFRIMNLIRDAYWHFQVQKNESQS